MKRGGQARGVGWLFVAPALFVITIFFVVPLIGSFVLSFSDFDIYAVADSDNARWIGLQNYRDLLADPLFWKSLGNTLVFVLLGGPLTIATSLALAMLLDSRLARFRGALRTIYFAPVVTTLVAVAVVWRYIFHPRFGLLNQLLAPLGLGPFDWLGDPALAMPSVILVAVWKNFGYNLLLFVAGLQNIPPQLYEAARIDGAGAWQQFRCVTVPMLAPTFLFIGITTMIGYFQLFAEPYVLTNGGGPLNATLSVVLHMYKQGFKWWNLGYAAAIAFVLLLVILAAARLQWWLQARAQAEEQA